MTLALDDTICAIATAPGGAVRGIVRISGSQTAAVLTRLGNFSPAPTSAQRATILSGSINLPQDIGPLEATVYWWPTRKSYTREPCAELHLPGSPPLLAAALQASCTAGARLAGPGEFTLRAFLAGRLDLTQAEAVLGVIDAQSRRQLDAALAQLAGGLARPLALARENLLDLLAHLEAGLDFVEEDIEFITRHSLRSQLAQIAAEVHAIARRIESRGDASERPRIVLYGLPNAGKSSLLNALAGDQAAIVSPLAGTTRDFVSRCLSLAGRECLLIDTAGIESAPTASQKAASLEATAQLSNTAQLNNTAQLVTHAERDSADLALLCIDRSQPLTPWDSDQIAALTERHILVWTKTDLPPAVPTSVPAGMTTSSTSGQGIEQLKRQMATALDQSTAAGSSLAATADRCRESLHLAAASLARALAACDSDQGEELIAAELRVALDELGRVIGAVYTDDILDRVFSRFCIGK